MKSGSLSKPSASVIAQPPVFDGPSGPHDTVAHMAADLPKIISVDDHVIEPPNVWLDRLPSKYHDVGPRIERMPLEEITMIGGAYQIKPGTDGPPCDWWIYEDLQMPHRRIIAAVGFDRDDITL